MSAKLYTLEAFNSSGYLWVIYHHRNGSKGVHGLYKTYDEASQQLNSLRFVAP